MKAWIGRNEDGTFNLSFCDERGVPFNEFYSIPESEACARVYSVANAKKRLYENEKKNNEGMSLH